MPFEIVRNDITQMAVDAIVNTANPLPVVGRGTDARIHEKAGPALLAARQKIGMIDVGCAAITPAFALQAKYVIHTVGPVWKGGHSGEEAMLRRCYDTSLQLALEHGCQSVAFPLIAAGNYGFPQDRALQTAIAAFSAFLTAHELQIYLVVFDRESYRLSERLFRNVASYIDENYIDQCRSASFRSIVGQRPRANACREMPAAEAAPPKPCSQASSLAEMLRQEDAGFTEKLLQLIDKSGKKDPEIYKKANITKQHFSKIRNNPDYRPTKPTAVAFAIALELDLAATRDLIGRAGFALTNSSKFDLIVRYFIEQGNYNIVEINIALYEFDQPLLGN